MKKALLLGILVVSTSVFASGWVCKGSGGDTENWKLTVKLFNHTTNTRVPAILVVSDRNQGTLLTAKNQQIKKTTSGRYTRYSANVKRSDLLHDSGWISVKLGVKYREGIDAAVPEDHEVPGYITFYQEDQFHDHVDLTCERYLKNE